LVFPNTYRVAMSNLGFLTLYRLFNARPDTSCERSVTDAVRRSPPGPRALESGAPLREFDVIAFSLPFENDYPDVLRMLNAGGIPAEASQRSEFDPVVIAGGKAISANPEPLAACFDAVFLGEVEPVFSQLADALARGKLERLPRAERLAALAEIPSAYLPSEWDVSYHPDGLIAAQRHQGHAPAPRPVFAASDAEMETYSDITSPDTEFADMHLVEVARGCPRGCRFCLTCWAAQRYRFRSVPALQQTIERHTPPGATIGLVGTSLGDLPGLEHLCQWILESGRKVSLSSLRIDSFTRQQADIMTQSGQRTLTLAPETAAPRLKRLINKRVADEQLFEAAAIAAAAGIRTLKLYFLIGLPGETDDDAAAIVELLKKLQHVLHSTFKGTRPLAISASVSSFVPKALTPFQWAPMAELADLQRRMKILTRLVPKRGPFSLHFDVPKWAVLQATLARGDRRLQAALSAMAKGTPFLRAFADVNLNPGFYAQRERTCGEILPWDHLCSADFRGKLAADYQRAQTVADDVDTGPAA